MSIVSFINLSSQKQENGFARVFWAAGFPLWLLTCLKVINSVHAVPWIYVKMA